MARRGRSGIRREPEIAARANTDAGSNVVPITTKPRASKGITITPKPLGQQKACCEGTKHTAIIDRLLTGATA